MIVVSDTTPINYLLAVDHVHILPCLFDTVVLPRGVVDELAAPGAPDRNRQWLASLPPSFQVVTVGRTLELGLDRGETEAICLAEELAADVLLIDEREGRKVAQGRSIHYVGTIGIIELAANRNLLDLHQVLDALADTSFRAPAAIVAKLRATYPRRSESD